MSGSAALVGRTGVVPDGGKSHSAGALGGASTQGGPAGPVGGGKRWFPHIDDITSVSVDIDPHAPVDKVLQTAETYLRQAESAKSFGRPEVALKDYLRTGIILVEHIKHNKDWVRLQGDNKGLLVRHQLLLQRVKEVHHEFDTIKAMIKADNERSGVRATVQAHGVNGGKRGPGKDGGAGEVRSKPAVNPKPKGLHGKILMADGQTVPPTQDLAARFAGLRANAASVGQDRRVRTQPIVAPVSVSQHDKMARATATATARPNVSLETTLAELPRVPDAIYSPARAGLSTGSTESAELAGLAELPSSASHSLFPRATSMEHCGQPCGPSCGPKAITPAPANDRLVPAQSVGSTNTPTEKRPVLPDGNTISPHLLVQLMKRGTADVRILLIDMRSREEFDQGHIMSQASICVEASVLRRDDISANEIADSMVLAPHLESQLFERRHEFELIVMYDQYSEEINFRPSTLEAKAVLGLYNALGQYDFGSPRKQYIKLLSGGIEAWTSLMGRNGLQPSPGRAKKAVMSAESLDRKAFGARPRYQAKPIQNQEIVSRWERSLADHASSPPIVSSTEDVLRRFPSIAQQESMFSPVRTLADPNPSLQDMYPKLPAPPSRPPPAVPRRSYSGLADTAHASVASTRSTVAISAGRRAQRVGLYNFGVTCYANATLQALFATPGLGTVLATGRWASEYGQVPKKKDEVIHNPQLMCKILQNLFTFLNSGNHPAIQPRTILDYIMYICAKNPTGAANFSMENQEDASELWSFIKDIVHDETDLLRDTQPYRPRSHPSAIPAITAAQLEWDLYRRTSDSMIDRYFKYTRVDTFECLACAAIGHNPVHEETLIINFTQRTSSAGQTSLQDLLRHWAEPEMLPEAKCDSCQAQGRRRTSRLARAPDRLVLSLARFVFDGFDYGKSLVLVDYPLRNLDLKPYFVDTSAAPADPLDPDNHYSAEIKYDLYAVVQHRGNSLRSGHYVAYVKDDRQPWAADDWWELNDTETKKMSFGKVPCLEKRISGKNRDFTAYMLFYARQGTTSR